MTVIKEKKLIFINKIQTADHPIINSKSPRGHPGKRENDTLFIKMSLLLLQIVVEDLLKKKRKQIFSFSWMAPWII